MIVSRRSSVLKEPSSLKEVIPAILKDRRIQTANVQVLAQRKEKKTKYTLILSWDEDEKKEGSTITSCEIKTPITAINTSQVEEKRTKLELTQRVLQKNYATMIKCDGPCRELRLPREVHSMGRCDHYICELCYKIYNNADGSIGCTAFSCIRGSLYRNFNNEDALNAYTANIFPIYQERKKCVDKKSYLHFNELPSVSNPPSLRMKNNNKKSSDNRKIVEKFEEITTKPLEPIMDMKVMVRAMVHYEKNGRLTTSFLTHCFPPNITVKQMIGYVIKKSFDKENFNGPVRASLGNTETYAVFLPMNNMTVEKSLIDYAGAEKRLNIVIDTLDKIIM